MNLMIFNAHSFLQYSWIFQKQFDEKHESDEIIDDNDNDELENMNFMIFNAHSFLQYSWIFQKHFDEKHESDEIIDGNDDDDDYDE